MPLPQLNPHTLEPTGIVLPVSDYFNPRVNGNFTRDFPSGHRYLRGFININDIKKVYEALAKPDYIDELIPAILSQFTGIVNSNLDYNRQNLRTIFDCLPDDKKWLIFSTMIYTNVNIAGGHQFNIHFRVPLSVVYNEIDWGTVNVRLDTRASADGRSFHPTVDQITAFKTTLETKFTEIMAYWDRISPNSMIVIGGSAYANIARMIIHYSADYAIFYPRNEDEEGPLPRDYYRPSVLREHLEAGMRITFSHTKSFDRLFYTASFNPGDRSRLARVMNYSTNVLSVLPYTIKGPKEVSAPTYGVELESCSDYRPRDMIEAQKDLFFIMKSDGSITGSKSQKYEIVTVPATLKAHKRLWAELFEKIDYNNFDTTKDTGNGMHVHIGRSCFTNKSHINRFTWFITNPVNFDFMFTISERPSKTDLSRWAAMPNYGRMRKYGAAQMAAAYAETLRGAVHFKGSATVEVRMFKGIVSYATIIKNLEFVDSVFHFTQTTGLSQLTLKNYIDWLNATEKNRYQTLKAFLSEIKLPDIVACAEVNDFVWNEAQDHVIAEKLNKAPFKVTNTHIKALNTSRRKRSFILKDGKVICVRTNGGLLAKLDKTLSKKQTRGAATFTMTEFAA